MGNYYYTMDRGGEVDGPKNGTDIKYQDANWNASSAIKRATQLNVKLTSNCNWWRTFCVCVPGDQIVIWATYTPTLYGIRRGRGSFTPPINQNLPDHYHLMIVENLIGGSHQLKFPAILLFRGISSTACNAMHARESIAWVYWGRARGWHNWY